MDGQASAGHSGLFVKLGFLLLGVFPTDIVTSVTVGAKPPARACPGGPRWYSSPSPCSCSRFPPCWWPRWASAHAASSPARDWMNANSWIVSEIVLAIFIVLEIRSLLA